MLGLQAGILIGNLTTFISIEVVTAITFTAAIESDPTAMMRAWRYTFTFGLFTIILYGVQLIVLGVKISYGICKILP